jgi:hypothetical protein
VSTLPNCLSAMFYRDRNRLYRSQNTHCCRFVPEPDSADHGQLLISSADLQVPLYACCRTPSSYISVQDKCLTSGVVSPLHDIFKTRVSLGLSELQVFTSSHISSPSSALLPTTIARPSEPRLGQCRIIVIARSGLPFLTLDSRLIKKVLCVRYT